MEFKRLREERNRLECLKNRDELTDEGLELIAEIDQALQLHKTQVSGSINSLLSKFDNGLELYQNNAVFANCIEHLLRGVDVYKILEQIIVMQQSQQKKFEEIISSGKIRQEIIVSKERFDELLKSIPKKCEHKNIKREDGLDECLDCGVRNY